MKTKYIEIIFRERSPSGKTCIWEIVSNSSGCGLGLIQWNGMWRQYVLYPNQGTMWSHECLDDVKAFLVKENEIHRATRKRGICG